MKQFLTAILSVALYQFSTAQAVTANDSVSLGGGASQMVFYSLATGTKTTSSNNDWHLAITVRATQFPNAPLGGTTIRINESSGVRAIYVPNADAAAFNTVDTTGWQSWRKLHDSDTAIDQGALNSNRSANIFDFGWGVYNSGSHNVVGDSLYLIQLPTGELKKFLVENLDKDTAFNLKYSNIDNSNLQTLKISKKNYQGKQFVYLNLLTNVVEDKEPLASEWDLLFLRYQANVSPDSTTTVVGVWTNKSAKVAEARGVDVTLNNYQLHTFSDNLDVIGWDWKKHNVPSGYIMVDSLAYFIQTQAGLVYKVIFTKYIQPVMGRLCFYKELVSGTSGIEEANQVSVAMFPNPTSDYVNISVGQDKAIHSVIVTDLSGRVLLNETANGTLHTLNTAELPNGFYVANITLGGQTIAKRFVVSR